MKQNNLLSLFFNPRQNKSRTGKNVMCDRCLRNNCGCHNNFMKQTVSKKIPFLNEIKKDYAFNENNDNYKLFSAGRPSGRTQRGKTVSRTTKAPLSKGRTIQSQRAQYQTPAKKPTGGKTPAQFQALATAGALASRARKSAKASAKAKKSIKQTTGKRPTPNQPKPKPKGVTTPFGGFESAQAQEDALVKMIEEEREARPEQFTGQADEIILERLKQEGVQKFDTVTTTGGNFLPYSMIEPANYPAKVFRHSKSANPLARFVEDVTVSYYGDDIDLLYKGHEAQEKKFPEIWANIKTKDDFYTTKFTDYDTKITALGKSVTDASEGGKFFGIPNQYLIIASLAIGVVALVMKR